MHMHMCMVIGLLDIREASRSGAYDGRTSSVDWQIVGRSLVDRGEEGVVRGGGTAGITQNGHHGQFGLRAAWESRQVRRAWSQVGAMGADKDKDGDGCLQVYGCRWCP